MLKKTSVFALAMLFVFTSFTGCLDSDDGVTKKEKLESIVKHYEIKDS